MRRLIFVFLTLCCLAGMARAESLVVATYNIRNANADDSTNGDGWGQRYPYIARLIQFHGFDIFGTQEGKYHQLQDLKAAMPGYDYIGVGRDDGKRGGEFSAIFYRTERFEVIDHGDFWLSTDTSRPNVGWDAALPYDELQARFTRELPRDARIFNEYHALLVRHCKESCRKSACGDACRDWDHNR